MGLDFDAVLDEIVQLASGKDVGYTPEEIEKIERLYDIKVSGNLEKFLLRIGRCSGSVLGDDELIFYRSNMKLRDHLITQHAF